MAPKWVKGQDQARVLHRIQRDEKRSPEEQPVVQKWTGALRIKVVSPNQATKPEKQGMARTQENELASDNNHHLLAY